MAKLSGFAHGPAHALSPRNITLDAMIWWLFVIGAAAGGFINGLAGFGTALFALGLWLQFMEPTQAVAIVVVLSVATGLQGLWIVRRAISEQRARLARFLLPALLGIPMGVAALPYLAPSPVRLVIGAFLILYGGFFTLRRNLPRFTRSTPVADGAVGFLGGFLGGAVSLSGALPTMWCAMRPWPKAETRAVLQPFNVVVLALTALLLAARGAYDAETLWLLALALPVALVAAQIGLWVFGRVSDDSFRRMIIALTLLSGAVILLRELL